MGEKESFSAENRVGAAEVVKRLLMDCGGERKDGESRFVERASGVNRSLGIYVARGLDLPKTAAQDTGSAATR